MLRPNLNRQNISRCWAGVSALLIAPLGCLDGGFAGSDRSWMGSVDTLESGRIVVQNRDVPANQLEMWTLNEAFRIGSLEGSPELTFGEIADVELAPDGALFVLDSQASEIRSFRRDGTHLMTFGRTGEGPGELSSPGGMTFGPDGNLWVLNVGNARYTVFDPGSGSLVAEHRRPASFFMIPWPGLFDHEGRLVDTGLTANGQPAFLVLDSAFAPRDTLPLPRSDPSYQIRWVREGRLIMVSPDPFSPQPSAAARPAGGIVYGEGEIYRLHHVTSGKDTVLTVRVLRDRAQVTSEEADSALESFRAFSQEAGATPEREPNVPALKPAHGAFFLDRENRTWVRRTVRVDEAPAWDIIDASGRLIAYAPIPEPLAYATPSVRDGRVALVTEVGGIPTVIVYDIGVGGVHGGRL